jgi:hypothetical protein
VRQGVVTRPIGRLDKSILSRPPIACKGDVVRALIEERDDR